MSIRKFLRYSTYTTLLGSTAAAATFSLYTLSSKFIPLSTSDPIFTSSPYLSQNPQKNPATQDLCERRVPLSKIKPFLLEKVSSGALVEAFCAGVWSGWGYAYQRSYLEKKYRNTTTTGHQLWDKKELKHAKYEVGTQITDHFEVVEKDAQRIVVRCGDSPLKRGVRESDGLFEMSVRIDKERGEAVFGLKSVFFQGLGRAEGKPMPSHVEFLHRLYTKMWMECAVSNCVL